MQRSSLSQASGAVETFPGHPRSETRRQGHGEQPGVGDNGHPQAGVKPPGPPAPP